MEFLFRLFHRPCFPRGELVALSGKAKSGKTFVGTILMALCQRSPVLSLERIEPRRLHVLWYDTEQSEESTQDILKHRVLPMTCGTGSGMIDVFNVRGEMYAERLPLLEMAVRHYRPDLVIVDGIRDFVADINDGENRHRGLDFREIVKVQSTKRQTKIQKQEKAYEKRKLHVDASFQL